MNHVLYCAQPLLHQLKHVAPLQLRVFLRDGLLQLGQEALTADATHTRLTMVRAAFPGPADNSSAEIVPIALEPRSGLRCKPLLRPPLGDRSLL